MSDYSQLSNSELMNIVQGGGAQPKNTAQNNSYSDMSDEQLLNIIQPEDQEKKYLGSLAEAGKSPLTVADSLKFSLLEGDTEGQQQLLKSKFDYVGQDENGVLKAGNNIANAKPVTPSWFTDPIARLSQSVADIPIVTLSIAGAIGGGALGAGAGGIGAAPGAIGGSAAGGAAGTAVNKLIGKAMGINKQGFESMAVDAAINGVGMGLAEGGGMVLNKVLKAATAKITAKKGFDMLEKGLTQGGLDGAKQAAVKEKFADTLKFTAGIDRDYTKVVIDAGPAATLKTETKGYLAGVEKGSEEHLFKLSSQIERAIKAKDEIVGDSIHKTLNEFYEKAGKLNLTEVSMDLQKNIFVNAEKAGLGVIKITKVPGKGNIIDFIPHERLYPEQRKLLNTLILPFKEFGGIESPIAKGQLRLNPEGKADIKMLMKHYSGLKGEIAKASDEAKITLINLKDGNVNPRYGEPVVGITDVIEGMAKKAGKVGDDYVVAKQQFREFSQLMQTVKERGGIDLTDIRSIQRMVKGGLVKDPELKATIEVLDKNMNTAFSQLIPMWKAAEVFSNSSPNYLRFGLVTGLVPFLGMLPAGGKVLAGLAIASPKGAGGTLMAFEKSGILGKLMDKKSAPIVKANLKNNRLIQRLLTRVPTKGAIDGIKNYK